MKNKVKSVYFIGIGGIGMSALARYFKASGYNVAGYDRTRTEVCTNLEKEGINIHYEDNMNFVGSYYKDAASTIVVYTPAIPAEHSELAFFKQNNFTVLKRAEALGKLCEKKNTIAVAGTHGKTSISTITACIMQQTDEKCTAFLGGISKNFMSNFHLEVESDFVVVEADEYDRSFLQLSPSSALISTVEADHLDIYGNYENMQEAFVQFANKLQKKGNLVLNYNIAEIFADKLRSDINVFTYSLDNPNCNFFAENISYQNGLCIFDINTPNGKISQVKFKIGGKHNIENAIAATALATINKVSLMQVQQGLEMFSGVQRRFDCHIKNDKTVYIDDYAHHPGEIAAFLNAVKQIYPERKITAIFQPHLYSRTNDFYEQFAQSLDICNNLILLPIYPARELPIEGVTSKLIYDKCTLQNKYLCEKEQLIEMLKTVDTELVVTMGAGDIDKLVKPVTEFLSKK